MRILIGSDHFGYRLKEAIRRHLAELGHEAIDVGCDGDEKAVDYPDVALELACKISDGASDRGILVCGTGIGMAISANKVPGVRAAVCHDVYSAERARKSNDAQVLCLGSQIVGEAHAFMLVDHWLDSEFGGGRSTPKVEKMKQLDRRYRRLEAP
jgi:ribose 5-phosphate isomerase B